MSVLQLNSTCRQWDEDDGEMKVGRRGKELEEEGGGAGGKKEEQGEEDEGGVNRLCFCRAMMLAHTFASLSFDPHLSPIANSIPVNVSFSISHSRHTLHIMIVDGGGGEGGSNSVCLTNTAGAQQRMHYPLVPHLVHV